MNSKCLVKFLFVFALILSACDTSYSKAFSKANCPQVKIAVIENMPNFPQPYQMRNWKEVALNHDNFVFDFDLVGEHLPLIWLDNTGPNQGFGLPSYVGDLRMVEEHSHEAINCVGAVITGTYAGIDKSSEDSMNWVLMCRNYFSDADGVYRNQTEASPGGSFWYDIFPNIAMFKLTYLYPQFSELEENMKTAADSWYRAVERLKEPTGSNGVPNFRWTAFDFIKNEPVNNGIWIEPDAAAGIAWLQYMAYAKFGDDRYLEAALNSLDFLELETANPFYEILLPFGAYAAARINAEQGYGYDVEKFINWCFESSDVRWGWGVTSEKWGDYDCAGLIGSLTDGGGYGFAMNTFVTAGQFVPMVRYDQRFARAIGKWMLNASNSSRFFYANGLPESHQTCWEWANDYDENFVLTYEGIRKQWENTSPFAMGDPLVLEWAETDFALYGSSWVGMMAALVSTTNVEGILKLDCLATDYFRGDAYPTYLYYNPHSTSKRVVIDIDLSKQRLYDIVNNGFIEPIVNNETNQAAFSLEPDSAAVIVIVPKSGKIQYKGPRTLIDGIVVDYSNGRESPRRKNRKLTRPAVETDQDFSKTLSAPRATIVIDGCRQEWGTLQGDSLKMDSGNPDWLSCSLRFAWDQDYFYVLAEEQPSQVSAQEALDINRYEISPWNFDGISLFINFDYPNREQSRGDVGDINLWLGFSSAGRDDLYCARSHKPQPLSQSLLSRSRVVTTGCASDHSRIIEAAISWQDISDNVAVSRQPSGDLIGSIKKGLQFGCDVLVISNDYRNQFYLGGIARPTGRDTNSRNIILSE